MSNRDLRRRVARLSLLILSSTAGCYAPRAVQSASTSSAGGEVVHSPGHSFQVSSDQDVVTVDGEDDTQLDVARRTIVASHVAGVWFDHAAGVARLHLNRATREVQLQRPLFVIDGVPLADDYTLTIPVRNIAR